MPKILAVADEIDEALYGPVLDDLHPDLVVSCGDLPADYLEYLVTRLNAPLVFVPGNHDPDLWARAGDSSIGLAPPPSLCADEAAPRGCTNADLQIVDAAGLRLAGLGGCVRYRSGPNQYTQVDMRRRARKLRARARARRLRDGRGVDVLLTHAPPFGVGDDDDPAHVGIEALHGLVDRLAPSYLLHGHIHPYGEPKADRTMGTTRVLNVIPRRILEMPG